MNTRYLLDTDICISVQRRRGSSGLTQRLAALMPNEAAISTISLGELFVGAVKSRSPEQALSVIAEFASIIPVLAVPASAAKYYGRIRAELERSGMTIGANDLWIAAHALAEELILVTNNEREFRRVDGLHVENWAEVMP